MTLKKGDVAYNVSEKFIVSDYNEMYEVIRQYMDDKEFYNTRRQEAFRYAKEHSENKLIDLFGKIKEIMINGKCFNI